jgi:hypothetical protein
MRVLLATADPVRLIPYPIERNLRPAQRVEAANAARRLCGEPGAAPAVEARIGSRSAGSGVSFLLALLREAGLDPIMPDTEIHAITGGLPIFPRLLRDAKETEGLC